MTTTGIPRTTKRPTLRDVAALAGASFKSVSRVVNDESGVSPGMRERVLAAVEELGYQPDRRAQTLRSASNATATIGYIQPDLTNPFYATILRGVADTLTELGHVVLSGSTDGLAEREEALVEAFVARRVDGLVVVPSPPQHDALQREVDRGTPVVCADIAPRGLEVDSVTSDNHGGSRTAVDHLIAHGHRRIAFLGDGGRNDTSDGRFRGYLDALDAAEIPVESAMVRTALVGPDQAYRAAQDLLGQPDPPTAVFSSQNLISYGAVKALHRAGLQHRVALVAFDDVEFSDVVSPAVSVISQDPLGMGRRAAELLVARIKDPIGKRVQEIMSVPLTVRGSGEIPGPHHS